MHYTPLKSQVQSSTITSEVLADVDIDPSWAFADKSRRDTSYITHGYHRYPAKFIPQLAARLIQEYSSEGDLVVDPFCGCGTTIVEAIVLGRKSIGADINPVATLISTAKTCPIEPKIAESYFRKLQLHLLQYDAAKVDRVPSHPRIDYWFRPTEQAKLAYLLNWIDNIDHRDLRTFFSCGFSNILKNCSIWRQKSNKPLRHIDKSVADPFTIITRLIQRISCLFVIFSVRTRETFR